MTIYPAPSDPPVNDQLDRDGAIRHALRDYFGDHEDARLATAIHLYETNEISLGKAARLADVSRFDMPEILREHGVTVKLGSEDMDDAQQEIDVARDLE